MKKILLASLIILLTACTGGGGGGGEVPGPGPGPIIDDPNDPNDPEVITHNLSLQYSAVGVRPILNISTIASGAYGITISADQTSAVVVTADQQIIEFHYDSSLLADSENYQVDFIIDGVVSTTNTLLMDEDKSVEVRVICINGTAPAVGNRACAVPPPPPRAEISGCYTSSGSTIDSSHYCAGQSIQFQFNLEEEEVTDQTQVAGIFNTSCSMVVPSSYEFLNNITNPVAENDIKYLDSAMMLMDGTYQLSYVLYIPDPNDMTNRTVQEVKTCIDLGTVVLDRQMPQLFGSPTISNQFEMSATFDFKAFFYTANPGIRVNVTTQDTISGTGGTSVELLDGGIIVGTGISSSSTVEINSLIPTFDGSVNKSLLLRVFYFDLAGNFGLHETNIDYIGAPQTVTTVQIDGDPTSSIVSNGQMLRINGTNFHQWNALPSTRVHIITMAGDDMYCDSVNFSDSTQMTCMHDFESIMPAAPEVWSIQVENIYTGARSNVGTFHIGQ